MTMYSSSTSTCVKSSGLVESRLDASNYNGYQPVLHHGMSDFFSYRLVLQVEESGCSAGGRRSAGGPVAPMRA